MVDEITYDTGEYELRWVSYFDLLGTQKLVNNENWFDVMTVYGKAIEECNKVLNSIENIGNTWFSDTFLIYSLDDSESSFKQIDLATRCFIYFLILAGIPVRGALSYGKYYVDKQHNIFFGPAFIEAHIYGESQDWIGYVITPSAVKQMTEIGLSASKRLNYTYWDIPYNKVSMKKVTQTLEKSLPAYIIGGHMIMNGKNQCLDKLYNIRDSVPKEYKMKYTNTINFIESNRRSFTSKQK